MRRVTKRTVRHLAITSWTVHYRKPISGYVHPEVLVDTEWVAPDLGDPRVRLVEVDVNTQVVLYGNRNAPAAMAFWLLKVHGHGRLFLMNGGRQKWVEQGRPMTIETPVITPAAYAIQDPDWSNRACRDDVQAAIGSANHALVDMHTAAEHDGESFWPSAPPQTGERAGHIPGAVHIPFEMTLSQPGARTAPTDPSRPGTCPPHMDEKRMRG